MTIMESATFKMLEVTVVMVVAIVPTSKNRRNVTFLQQFAVGVNSHQVTARRTRRAAKITQDTQQTNRESTIGPEHDRLH